MKQFILVIFILILLSLVYIEGQIRTIETLLNPPPTKSTSSVKKPQKTNYVLYVSNVTGNNDIYLLNVNTKQIKNLTHIPADDMNPQLSPDKTSIVFYSNRDGDAEIYRMDLKTGKTVQLTSNTAEDYDPSFSPDGKHIVYKSDQDDGLGDIFIMDTDGKNRQNLTLSLNTTEEWDPVYNNDGSRIYFVQRTSNDHMTDELFVIDADGQNVERISKNDVPDWYPTTNLQDNRVLFVSKERPDATESIYTMDEQGKNVTKVATMPGNSDDPSWSEDAQKIIFINDRTGQYDIYLMNANGSNVEKLTDTQATELSPIIFTR